MFRRRIAPAVPVRDAIPAFAAPAVASDSLPAAAAAEIADLATGQSAANPGARIGSTSAATSRLLLKGLGGSNVSLYGVPTDKGEVCTVFSAVYGSPGCFSRFTADSPISFDVRDVDAVGSGAPAIVDGLVPNTVSSVDVVVGGKAEAATLGKSAFFYELSDATQWPDAILVHYRSGAQQSFPIASVAH
jgi:hypothetical protein